MNLAEISIRRPVFAWMLMVGLIAFGAISFTRMGISQLPDVDFPVVNIALSLQNAAPAVMESDVVDPVEDAVMGIEGIRSVSSNASQGAANVTVEFEIDRNIDVALQEVQTRIAQAARRLPSKLDPPAITKTNPEDQPILWVMLTSDGSVPLYKQMIYARNTLKNQFSTLAGVGSVTFGGYVDPNLRVWLNEKKLRHYDLTANDVLTTIQNEQIEQPAGRIENPTRETNVRLQGEALTPEEFAKIRINSRGGAPNYKPLYLGEVARIEEGLSDLRAISRYSGKPAVGLGIVKQRGSNAVDVARRVSEKVKQLQPVLPKGLFVDSRLDSTKFIRESVSELNFTLVLSAILTSLVCYLFLGSFSSTLNVLMAIPTSIVGAFIALYFYGFTLNTFTLLGLSLAIGIVVDDAIMMLENIVRHAEMGKDKREAALVGAKEITFAALAATIAIAAIFIPVIFMKGVIGRFFYQYGITVTVAVFLSLLEALTLTPMRCSRFLQVARHGEQAQGLAGRVDTLMARLAASYRKTLERLLNARWLVVGGSLVFFLISLVLLGPIRKELIPQQDQSLFVLTLKAPVGTSITASDSLFKRAEAYLASQAEVLEYYTTIGNYQGQDIVNVGQIFVTLKDSKARKAGQREIMDRSTADLEKLLPNTQVFAQDLSLSGFSASRGFPIELMIQGPDWKKLAELSKEYITRLKATGLVSDVNTDYQEGMPELEILPDRAQSAQKGVSVANLGTEISTLIGGQIFTSATQYPKDGHRYDIRVRSEPDEHSEQQDLARLYVRNNRGTAGELVAVESVVKTEVRPALQIITRLNRERAIAVFANVAAGKSQQDALKVAEEIGRELLPRGYRVAFTGSATTFRESFDSLLFALILGIAVSYMVLASQFNSFIHPVTVLMALPFSLSGAFFALYFGGQSLNLFSMIGLILLMGIVKKNSILLVDFTNQRRAEGLEPRQALLEACPVRLRPILMTSIATVAGAVPAALALGPGSETRVPMAISIIGGVFVSTVLTLFVVPCVYSLFTKVERPDDELA
jgi:HAE1 family hydrophobic/amphiphilic exporter-1